MSEKGFSLVELIGVLVLLSVIVLVAFPNILTAIQGTNQKIEEATEQLLIANAKSYINDTLPGRSGCVNVSTLVEEGYTETPIANSDSTKSQEIQNSWSVHYDWDNGKYVNFNLRDSSC